MKILITGMTATQVNSQKRIVKYTSYPEIYGRCLEKAGHKVTFRPVIVGEDLREYDRVIIGLAPVNALNAKHMFGALWALHLLHKDEVRGAIQMDDWAYRMVFSGARSMSKDFNKRLYDKNVLTRDHKELVKNTSRFKKAIETVITNIGDKFFSNVQIISPLLPNGDHMRILAGTPLTLSSLIPVNVLSGCDWSHWEEQSKNWNPVKRRRVWIHAALPSNKGFAERIKASSWAVEHYGPTAVDKKKLPEHQLIQKYWEVNGLIAMPYYHAGSGWCRARFVHAAAMGAVMACDKREGEVIGPSYTMTMNEIEKLKPVQLRELATSQASELRKVVQRELDLVDRLDSVVRNKL